MGNRGHGDRGKMGEEFLIREWDRERQWGMYIRWILNKANGTSCLGSLLKQCLARRRRMVTESRE